MTYKCKNLEDEFENENKIIINDFDEAKKKFFMVLVVKNWIF